MDGDNYDGKRPPSGWWLVPFLIFGAVGWVVIIHGVIELLEWLKAAL